MGTNANKHEVLEKLDVGQLFVESIPTLRKTATAEASGLCPFHDDQNPSFSVNLETGLWCCHAGCGGGDVVAFVMKQHDLSFGEALQYLNNHRGDTNMRERSEAIRTKIMPGETLGGTLFRYEDSAGRTVFHVQRIEQGNGRKRFIQWGPTPDGEEWQNNMDFAPTPRPLYRLSAILVDPSQTIVFHEGEKAVEAAMRAGLPGCHTTTVGGASNPGQSDFSPLLGRDVVICPDNDKAGERYATKIGRLAQEAGAKTVRLLTLLGLPPKGDVVEWLEGGGTREGFEALMQTADSFHPYKVEGCNETNPSPSSFAPTDLATLLATPQVPVPWVWEGYAPEGGLVTLAGFPKTGKSTLATHLIKAVALGEPFVGLPTKAGKVLLLALEEHSRDVVERLRAIGGAQLEGRVLIHAGPLPYNDGVLKEIGEYVRRADISLVVIDTLPVWWSLKDENDASEVIRKGKPLIQMVRATSAAWLALAHNRKGGGEHGQEVRGSSALIGLVDVGISLKRGSGVNQRVLEAVSRYADTPADLVVALGEDGQYRQVAASVETMQQESMNKIREALAGVFLTQDQIREETGLSSSTVSRLLKQMEAELDTRGAGKRGDPLEYTMMNAVADYLPELNEGAATISDT